MDFHVNTDPQSHPLTIVMKTRHTDDLPRRYKDPSSSADQEIYANYGPAHADVQTLQRHFRESRFENGELLDPKPLIGYHLKRCPYQHGHDILPIESPSQQSSPIECFSQQGSPASEFGDYPEQLALDDLDWRTDDATFRKCFVFRNFVDQERGLRTFECIINMIGLDHTISPDELMTLWPAFLDYEQRFEAPKLFENTDWHKDTATLCRTYGPADLGH